MIKKILLSGFILLSLPSFAQEGTASPYSYNGIGIVKFQGTVENKSMGGLGILPDSIHINLQNPASLSALKLTTFSIAGTYNTVKLKNEATVEKATRTTLDYLAMAFPIGKLGVSLGLMPYSAVGYKIKNEKNITLPSSQVVTETLANNGTGGVSKVFVGAGYKITPKLSVGADMGYSFGKTESSSVYSRTDIQFATMEVNTATLNGLNFNSGAIYKSKLKKYDLVSSVTFSPATNLKSKNTRSTSTVPFAPSGEGIQETPIANSIIKIPTKFAFGAGLGEIKKWFIGFESTFQGSSNPGNTNNPNATFENATKIALGGYYIPNYNSFSNYLNKITYRAGFRHENTGLVIKNNPINDTALTLGFGLPVGGNVSNVNIGLEYGKKGTKKAGLIQENYMNISIGLSFNDRWFVKRKFD